MKTIILALLLIASVAQADTPIEKKLQQALFAEEATRDLDAAIAAYNDIIADYDTQRKFAATAIFRLAECHRKKDQDQQAIAAYQRLLREFPAEETLARLASENLATLGAAPTDQSATTTSSSSEAAEIARIKQLVAQSPDLLNDPQTGLIHEAAAKSQLEVAAFLIESGSDVNLASSANQKSAEPPLEVATASGHLAMAELLLANGAELTSNTFTRAVMAQRTAVLDILLKAAPKNQSELFTTAVYRAALGGRADYLKKLIAHGATPANLTEAVASGSVESVQLLLDAGVTPDESAVALSAQGSRKIDPKDEEQIFNLIWEHSSKPLLALKVALEQAQNPQRALTIINSLEEIDTEDGLGTTVLSYVAFMNNPELVRAVLARGADPNTADSGDEYPLRWAISTRQETKDPANFEKDLTEILDLLLNAGADIDAKGGDGNTVIATVGRGGRSKHGPFSERYIPDAATERLLAAKPDPLRLDIESNPLTSSLNKLVRRYALLRMADRAEHVWYVVNDSSHFFKTSSHPLHLSELILSRVKTKRTISYYPPGEFEAKTIDYAAIITAGDTSKDPILPLGTIVDFTADDSAKISPEDYDFLQRAAAKNITISRGDHHWKGEARPGDRPDHTYDPSQHIAYASTVTTLLDSIHAPKITSDLTRIEVKHHSGETTIVNYLIAQQNAAADLTLRDSDHIILHPITTADLSDGIWISCEADLFLHLLGSLQELHQPNVTLGEILAACYSSGDFVLPHPDMSRLTIQKEKNTVAVNLEKMNHALSPGEIINIPALDEPDDNWQQLDETIITQLAKFLARDADFNIVGGTIRKLTVGPQFYQFPVSNGLRSTQPLATPEDSNFDVLGLSAATAIRHLGYHPTDQVQINYNLNDSSSWNTIALDQPIPTLPIITPGALVTIQMGTKSPPQIIRHTAPRGGSRKVPNTKNTNPAPPVSKATIDALNRAKAATAAAAQQRNTEPKKKPTSGRRVVLPPKSR